MRPSFSPHPFPALQTAKWAPPPLGLLKLNFDAGRLAEWGRGLGFVVRDSVSHVVLAGSNQSAGFYGPEVAEAEACLFGIQQAL